MPSLRCAALLLFAACTTPPAAPFARQWQGTVEWEGHLARPHATSTNRVTVRLQGAGEIAHVEIAEEPAGGRTPPPPLAIARDRSGTVWLRESGAARYRPDEGPGARLLELLSTATRATSGMGSAEHRIEYQHPRLGDIADLARWHPGQTGPQLEVLWHQATTSARLTLEPDAAPAPEPAAWSLPPDTIDPRPRTPTAGPARFRTLAPGVHELVLVDADTRSLAIEFADHVVLCEASLDNGAGERLLAALDAHLPGKPVRFVLFGHYHPHYTGGLRPVLARGATVLAPPLGAEFAREIAARPFQDPPDALAASGRTAQVEAFTGERRFADATNELVAIDIGLSSHHTEEYVVFWLPRQRWLFEGDLGWFQGPEGLRAGGRRARGLLEAIDARHLPVETLVQGWPAVGAGQLGMAEFRQMAGQ
jgi:hypothetical protein